MNLAKRIKALFVRPERKLAAILPELKGLRQELQRAINPDDPLSEIVHFFDTVSKWHDRGLSDYITAFEEVNTGQFEEILEKLHTLQKHFVNAGRDKCGWNRTEPGTQVTSQDVFLGGIYGLFTHPVSYWRQRKNEAKGGWGFPRMEHLNSYDVIAQHARDFMASHCRTMITLIDGLTAAA